MSTTKLIMTKNLNALVQYSMGKNEFRAVSVSSVNCSVLSAGSEMMDVLKLYGKTNQIQGMHVIQTFRNDELDPNDIDDIERANKAGSELVRKMWPTRQALVVTQIDGASGLIHNHICLNQADLYSGRSLRDKEKNHFHVARANDEVLESLGIENVLAGKKAYYRDDKSINEESAREAGHYLGKDDVLKRLEYVLSEQKPKSLSELSEFLSYHGIDVTFKDNDPKKVQFCYEDIKGKSQTCMGRRLKDKDGKKYDIERLNEVFEHNSNHLEPLNDNEKRAFEMRYKDPFGRRKLDEYVEENPRFAEFYDELKNRTAQALRIKADQDDLKRKQAEEAKKRQEERQREQENLKQMEEERKRSEKVSEGSHEPLDGRESSDDVIDSDSNSEPSGVSDDDLMRRFREVASERLAYKSEPTFEREFGD